MASATLIQTPSPTLGVCSASRRQPCSVFMAVAGAVLEMEAEGIEGTEASREWLKRKLAESRHHI
jgi:hypothetical protein